MTVYHTATQEDYGALMVELEEKGYKWANGKPTEINLWRDYGEKTCVELGFYEEKELSIGGFEYFERRVKKFGKIIEYKAKKKPEEVKSIDSERAPTVGTFRANLTKATNGNTLNKQHLTLNRRSLTMKKEDEEPYEIKKEKTDDELAVEEMKEMGINLEQDIINKPNHYHSNGVDVIGFAEAQFSKEELKGFYRINAIKYITRFDRKNGVEDLEKAQFYLNKLLEGEE